MSTTLDLHTAAALSTESADRAVLPAPRGLLLDFGGVVVTTTKRPTWARELAERIVHRARPAHLDLTVDEVEQSLLTGRTALSLWKNAASRRLAPTELTAREVVEDFLLADLAPRARAVLGLDAGWILAEMGPLVADHAMRPGIPALLELCRERGIGLAIVSNAHSGRAHRRILDDLGLGQAFGVQLYSDEVGIRKPHPGMIHRAAEALGLRPEQTWYVGDTLDRDVTAGRRARAGAVLITRDSRTERPPFAVQDAPDLVVDTPADLVEPLRRALDAAPQSLRTGAATPTHPGGATTATGPAQPRPVGRPVLFLDHGGVITSSRKNPERERIVGGLIRELSERIGHPISRERAERAVADGWERHRAWKRERVAAGGHEEITPVVLWGDIMGCDLPEPVRAALRIEAPVLSLELHRTKSLPTPRPGALELIRWCHEHDVVVGIVSNTVSGRGVREILARYGVAELIGPAAFSDEVGVRKPGRAIFEAALAGVDADRADVVYVGDKAVNDGRGGREAGIGTICLLRDGQDEKTHLEQALADGTADHLLDSPAEVIDILAARLPR